MEGSPLLPQGQDFAEGELVPPLGCCSKGGLCAALLALPFLLPLAAIGVGVASHASLLSVVPSALALSLVLFLILVAWIVLCVDPSFAFQIWALQRPGNPISQVYLPLISFLQGVFRSTNNEWMHQQRLDYGDNFCCAGEVVVGSFHSVEKALTQPQARAYYLGQSPLIKSRCPGTDGGPRPTFLLAMSDQGAGGNGDREKFRKCMEEYLIRAPATIARSGDAKARGMIEQLAKEYTAMNRDAFFWNVVPNPGLEMFIIRFYHYTMFDLELEGEDQDTIFKWYTGDGGNAHFVWPMGYFMGMTSVVDKVQAIYERSSVLKQFEEGCAAHGSMTKAELCRLACAVVRIAAKTGTLQLARCVLGGRKLPSYSGEKTGDIDVTKFWDKLNLQDSAAIQRYILEVARLFPPVNAGHRVSAAPFTVSMKGTLVSFPAGTIVMVPVCYGNLDKGFWGPTTFDFDAERRDLAEYHMGFNSVGDRSGGRICPGREMVLGMLVEVLRVVGEARRRTASTGKG